jgi:hypothetical protein
MKKIVLSEIEESIRKSFTREVANERIKNKLNKKMQYIKLLRGVN